MSRFYTIVFNTLLLHHRPTVEDCSCMDLCRRYFEHRVHRYVHKILKMEYMETKYFTIKKDGSTMSAG